MTFDREKARQTMTAQTKGGWPVMLLTTEGREPYPIVGYVGDNAVSVKMWTENGKLLGDGVDSKLDLINTPLKREGWAPYRRYESMGKTPWHISRSMFDTKEEAEQALTQYWDGVCFIQWEE